MLNKKKKQIQRETSTNLPFFLCNNVKIPQTKKKRKTFFLLFIHSKKNFFFFEDKN